MSKGMIKELVINSCPGFVPGKFPPIQKIGEGLNVVWGPNGVGKSSMAKTMRILLWKSPAPKGLDASATVSTQEGDFLLYASAEEVRQVRKKDNQDMETTWGINELSQPYWFPLHELLQKVDNGDANSFANKIRTLMQGGVDMTKVCNDVGAINQFPKSSSREFINFSNASSQLSTIKKEQETNLGIQGEIQDLKRELENRESLQGKLESLRGAESYLKELTNNQDLTNKLSQFPDVIEHISPSDPTRIRELSKDLEERHSELLKIQTSLQTKVSQRGNCNVTESLVQDGTLVKRLAIFRNDLPRLKAKYDNAKESQTKAVTAESEWTTQHQWLFSEPFDQNSFGNALKNLKNIANCCEPLRCEYEACRRTVEQFGQIELVKSTVELENMRSLVIRLSNWSKAFYSTSQNESCTIYKSVRQAQLFTAILSLIIALTVFLISPWCVLGVILIPLILWISFLKQEVGATSSQNRTLLDSERTEAEKLLKQLPAYTHTEWTPEACSKLQVQLRQDELQALSIVNANKLRETAKDRLNKTAQDWTNWCQKWHNAVQALNIDPENPRLERAKFFDFSDNIEHWLILREEMAKATEIFNTSRTDIEKMQQELQSSLPESEGKSYLELLAMAEDLQERIVNAIRLDDEIKGLKIDEEAKTQAVSEKRQTIIDFWDMRGLKQNDSVTLDNYSAKIPERNDIIAQKNASKERLIQILNEHPQADEDSKTSLEELTKMQEDIKRKLAALDILNQQLGALENRYKELLEGNALAEANHKYSETKALLEQLRRNSVLKRIMYHLTDELQKKSESECQPKVLKAASAWFERITEGRYQLSVNEMGFFAFDTVTERNLTLDQLSSGTRVHLLFSVRLAFIEAQEESIGLKLPIFLDELLANSDDQRAFSIVQALSTIAQERQIFYFTAQKDEVEKLKSFSSCPMKEIPLFELTRQHEINQNPMPKHSVHTRIIPDPVPDYLTYFKLCKVPGTTIWTPISELHSWYLFTKSDELHNYLMKGLERIGQIKTIFKGSLSLIHRIELLKQAQGYAQKGRCNTLTAVILEKADIDINKEAAFWKQTIDFMQKAPITARQLLDAIDNRTIKGYREDTRRKLEQWLTENFYLTLENPMSNVEILFRLQIDEPTLTVGSEDRIVVERWLGNVISETVQ